MRLLGFILWHQNFLDIFVTVEVLLCLGGIRQNLDGAIDVELHGWRAVLFHFIPELNTFYEQIGLPNNPEEQKKYALYGDSEKWMPVPNKGRFFKGELDPSQCVEVSNMGRVRFIDGNDALKSGINKGVYFAPTRNGVQVHINAIGADGKPLRTTGLLANMVIDAWFDPEGELDKNKYKVIYLDGNPQNCRLDNLDYVPIQRGRKRKTNQNDTTVESMANRISKMIIENLKRF